MTETNAAPAPVAKRKLSVIEHIACGWPIALVAIGGAVGGACGGAAWAINMKIMQSSMAPAMRYVLCVVTGIGAIIAYFVIVSLIVTAFPNLFAPH